MPVSAVVEKLKGDDNKPTKELILWARWERARNDLYYFLANFVYTMDEHDLINPVKKLPFSQKEYLQLLAREWLTHPRLLIPKSRQIMVTWTMLSCYLWDTMFNYGRLNFVQSKKEEDSDRHIERTNFIYEHIPADYLALKPPALKTYCHLKFPTLKSEMWGIPQGVDVGRQHTLSGIFVDEMSVQDNAETTYTSLLPALIGGGRFTGVATSNGKEFFYGLVHDLC